MLFLYNPDGRKCRVGHLTFTDNLVILEYSNIRRHLTIPNLLDVSIDPSRQVIYFFTTTHIHKFSVNDNFVNNDQMLLPSPMFKLISVPHDLDITLMYYHVVASINRVYLSPKIPSFEPIYDVDFDQAVISPISFLNPIECVSSSLMDGSLVICTKSGHFIVSDGQIIRECTEPIKVSYDKESYITSNMIVCKDRVVKFPSNLSFYGNKWVVCLNKLCDLSGTHMENCPDLPNITDQVVVDDQIYTEVCGIFNQNSCSVVLDWVAIMDSKDDMEYFTRECKTVIFCTQPEDDKNYTFYDALSSCKEIIHDKEYLFLVTDQIKPESLLFKQKVFSGTNQVNGHVIKTPDLNLEQYMDHLLSFHPERMIEATPTEIMFINENIIKCDLTDIYGLKVAYNTYHKNIIDVLMVKELQERICSCDDQVVMVVANTRQINWLKVLLKEQGYDCVRGHKTCYDVIFGK